MVQRFRRRHGVPPTSPRGRCRHGWIIVPAGLAILFIATSGIAVNASPTTTVTSALHRAPGVPLWSHTDAEAGTDLFIGEIAISGDRAIATGSNLTAYDVRSGDIEWTDDLPSWRVAFDQVDNRVYVAGAESVLAIGPSAGHVLWTRKLPGARDLTPGPGVVYVTAEHHVLALRATNGHTLWSLDFGGGWPEYVAVSDDGEVVLTAYTFSHLWGNCNEDPWSWDTVAVRAVDGTDGRPLWRDFINEYGFKSNDSVSGAFFDSTARAFLVGLTTGGACTQGDTPALMRFDPRTGEASFIPVTGDLTPGGFRYMALTRGGGVVATGTSGWDESSDIVTTRVSKRGRVRWSETFDQAAGFDRPAGIALDAGGTRALLAGLVDTKGTSSFGAALLSYDLATGDLVWSSVRPGFVDEYWDIDMAVGGSKDTAVIAHRTVVDGVGQMNIAAFQP